MIHVDLKNGTVTVDENSGDKQVFPLDSPEAFYYISRLWLRCGWDNKYVYSFTWMGRPIIQLPDDLLRLQELIFTLKPDVIVETGIAHGGSLIFYASLCKVLNRGRVIGVDIEIRPHNRKAIESHELFPYITLFEGDSTAPAIIEQVKKQISPDEKVLVLLDSCHTKEHVLKELHAYAPLVSTGSYIVAMDGIMQELEGAPRTNEDWIWNNPQQAAKEFVENNPGYIIEEPAYLFNEGSDMRRVTYFPNGFIKKLI